MHTYLNVLQMKT